MYMRRPVNNSFKVDEYAWSMFVVIVASFSIFNFLKAISRFAGRTTDSYPESQI